MAKTPKVDPAQHLEDRETTTTVDVDGSIDGTAADADAGEEPAPQYGLQVVGSQTEDTTYEDQENMSSALAIVGQEPAGSKEQRTRVAPSPVYLGASYEINKFRVKERLLECEYVLIMNYDGMQPVRKTMKSAGGLPVHNDLMNLLRRLVPFLAHATEQEKHEPCVIRPQDAMPIHLQKYNLIGVSIGTDGGYVLTGTRTLKNKQKLPLNTPHIPKNTTEKDSWYEYAENLEEIITELTNEVVLALDGKGFNPQMTLFDQEQEAAA